MPISAPTYRLYLVLLVFMLTGCDVVDAKRDNVNNPVCYQGDSVSLAYYLTTADGELTTTFRKNETMVVHYDITNETQHTLYFAHDYVYQYPYLIFGKCYTSEGKLVEDITFHGVDFSDGKVYSRSEMYPVFTLQPNEVWRSKRSVEACADKGKYYFELMPQLQIYSSEEDTVLADIWKMPAQKVHFYIVRK